MFCLAMADSHTHRITCTKCRINTVVSPYDRHIVARNTYRLIYMLRINCAPSWPCLQEHLGVRNMLKTLRGLFRK